MLNGYTYNYTYNQANQLVKVESSDGKTTEYQYGKNGNLTEKRIEGRITTYTYDSEDRLISINLPSGEKIEYTYDPLGNRYRKDNTQYLYDTTDILYENNRRYLYGEGIDNPIAINTGTETYFYLTERLNTVIALTDQNGSITNHYLYDPFGNIIKETETILNPIRFTSREWDADTKLYYYRARYYDPEVGRFITKDPSGKDHFYIYVQNNPGTFVDPMGTTLEEGMELINKIAQKM